MARFLNKSDGILDVCVGNGTVFMRNAIIHRQTFRVRQAMDYNEIHQGLSWEQPREGKHEI